MKKCCLMVGLVLGLAGLVSATTYDLNTDMDFTSNPNGAWSYGYIQNGTPTMYNTTVANVAGMTGLHVWCMDSDPDARGNVLKNTTGSDVDQPSWPNGMHWYAGKTHTMTAFGGGYGVGIEFTAPSAGFYDINASFLKATTGDTAVDVLVLINGSPVLSERISNDNIDAAYGALNVNLAAGAKVNLVTLPVAGSGMSNGGFIITQVDATITSVPEPATLVLLSLGGLLLRRKK